MSLSTLSKQNGRHLLSIAQLSLLSDVPLCYKINFNLKILNFS